MFLREPYVSLSCVQWKKYFFDHFQAFFIVFDHENTCPSMHSLVKYTTYNYSHKAFLFGQAE